MAAFWTTAEPEALGVSSAGLQRIDAFLAEQIAAGQLAGVSTLVARRGQVIHRAVQGKKNLASGEALMPDTIFRYFSMTKPVTAAAMMVLHEQGRWAVDDPIAKHLPEFATVKGPDGAAPSHAPTMGELMTHTAGFAYGIGPGPHDAADKACLDAKIWEADGLADFARRVAGIPLAYQPGSAWRYSLSMDLQGAVIERLTGQSLPDFMRAHLFEPLGMVDTGFYVPTEKLPRLASLYHMYGVPQLTELTHPGFARDPKAIPSVPSGGGGLYGTLEDYARFAQMLAGAGAFGDVRVLKPESVALMTANHLPQAIIDRGVDAGFQRIGPGRGYAFNGAVYYEPKLAGSRVGRGTYQWDGAGGTWFWVDPENELIFVGLIQRMLQDGMARLQELTQDMIADALVR